MVGSMTLTSAVLAKSRYAGWPDLEVEEQHGTNIFSLPVPQGFRDLPDFRILFPGEGPEAHERNRSSH